MGASGTGGPRPDRVIAPYDDGTAVLAVDVGATRTRLATLVGGRIVERAEHLTADLAGESDLPAWIAAAGIDLVGRTRFAPAAVGVGAAAAIGLDGTVLAARPFGLPAGDRLGDALRDALGVPVVLDNDANLAARAEHAIGAAAGSQAAAVITIGTNIGLGLVLDGRVYRGARGAAGEAGLLLVPAADRLAAGSDGRLAAGSDGRLVDAGRLGGGRSDAPGGYAWIEELVGGAALEALARELVGLSPGADRPSLTDPRAAAAAHLAVEGWALLVADLTSVLDLDLVVLTGRVVEDATPLLDRLRTRVAELVAWPPEIRVGALGPDAELLGADLLARATLASRAHETSGPALAGSTSGGNR
ncbi:MAG TPA: ROK family protein [Candidatus Limnocylindrales bacterium]|nr:ROK family protein [Candidatus Limnocylindrales bacterium]